MSEAQEQQPEEFVPESGSSESVDEIYVPGIGVRAALSEDLPQGPGKCAAVSARAVACLAGLWGRGGHVAAFLMARTRNHWARSTALSRERVRAWRDWERDSLVELYRLVSCACARLVMIFRRSPQLAAILLEMLERSWQQDRSKTVRALQRFNGLLGRLEACLRRTENVLTTAMQRSAGNLRALRSMPSPEESLARLCHSFAFRASLSWKQALRESETWRLRGRTRQLAMQQQLRRIGSSVSAAFASVRDRPRNGRVGEANGIAWNVDGLRRSAGAVVVLLIILTFVVQIMLGLRR